MVRYFQNIPEYCHSVIESPVTWVLRKPTRIIRRDVETSLMIDQEKLRIAYDENRFYSLQLEVGDRCVQGCSYCYMNALEQGKNTLTDNLIKGILEDANRLGITAVEWLGGEPLLRRSVFDHMARAVDLGFRNNVWTGGLPLSDKTILENTVIYARKGLIAVHISTVSPELYQILHPSRPVEDLVYIIDAVKRVLDIGYPADQMLNSVTFTGLQTAEDMIGTIQYFQSEFSIKTSLNVYHSYLRPRTPLKELARFIPKKDEVKKVYDFYSLHWGVRERAMNCVNKQAYVAGKGIYGKDPGCFRTYRHYMRSE